MQVNFSSNTPIFGKKTPNTDSTDTDDKKPRRSFSKRLDDKLTGEPSGPVLFKTPGGGEKRLFGISKPQKIAYSAIAALAAIGAGVAIIVNNRN